MKADTSRAKARTAPGPASVSHNLYGQRLGRKGRDTRERILAVAAELVANPEGEAISLSAIARRASLGMTSLYLYFNDLTELLLALLEPVSEQAEEAYVALLRERWGDDELGERCREWVSAYHAFWMEHARILHLRNAMADSQDTRMMQQRVRVARPTMRLLVAQMDGDPDATSSETAALASMLMTGIERAATVWTDPDLPSLLGENAPFGGAQRFLQPAARLLELGIRDARAQAKAQKGLAA